MSAKEKQDILKQIRAQQLARNQQTRDSEQDKSQSGMAKELPQPQQKKQQNQQPINLGIQNQEKSGPLTTLSLKEYKDFRRNCISIIETHAQDKIITLMQTLCVLGDDDGDDDQLQQYSDKQFPDTLSSIATEKNNLSISAKQIYGDIQFQKIMYVAEESFKLRFCNQAEDPFFYTQQFIQGNLGDIQFLNALILTCSNQQLFQQLCCLDIIDEEFNIAEFYEKGIYTFKFSKNKHQKYSVAIDDKIPCLIIPPIQKAVPAFSRSAYENEFWISLIEKAYAKLHGGYDKLESIGLRQAINDLTGLEPEIIPFMDQKFLNKTNFFNYLVLCQQNKTIVGFIREIDIKVKGPLANKTILNRMYVFSSIDIESNIISIINPWSGAPLKADDQNNNQMVKITFEEFYTLFTTIVTIKDFPDEFSGQKFEITLDPSNGIPTSNNSQWINNQQFLIDISDKVQVTTCINVKQIIGIQSTRYIYVGFAVIQLTSDKEQKVKTLNLQYLKLNVKGEFDDQFAQGIITLGQGRYAIIPFTNVKGDKGVYLNMEIYYDCNPNKIKIYDKCEKILSSCVGEKNNVVNLRKIRDSVAKNNLSKSLPITAKQENIQPWFILVPFQTIWFVIENQAQLFPILKDKDKNQKSANQNIVSDPLLENFQEIMINQVFLGIDEEYDNSQNQEIDPELQDQIQKEIKGIYDFNDYYLGDVGVTAVIELLVGEIEIYELYLSGNNLTDKGILNICYEIQASHHLELTSLDLSNNEITQKGAEVIRTFLIRFKNLQNINLDGNPDIPAELVDKIYLLCQKRREAVSLNQNSKKTK